MKPLRIVAWDDPRCTDPLRAVSPIWKAKHNQDIKIMCRSLSAFNDQPLSEISPICDVMIVDYPHMCQAVSEEAIADIHTILPDSKITPVTSAMIGTAQQSFQVGDTTPAIASDAACQLSAYRPHMLQKYGYKQPPATWESLIQMVEKHPQSVVFSTYPSDICCIAMSLVLYHGAVTSTDSDFFSDTHAGMWAIEMLKKITQFLPAYCWQSTPQRVFQQVQTDDTTAYIAFTFGYPQKSTLENGGWRYTSVPENTPTIMGGAGMAVSSKSPQQQQAGRFIIWYCGQEGQIHTARNGGLPSGVSGWKDSIANSRTHGYYSCVKDAQIRSVVRPLARWWPNAQIQIGETLCRMIQAQAPTKQIFDTVQNLYQHCKTL